MGLFSLGKKSEEDSTVVWLRKVDAAYTKSFQVKNAVGCEPYMTRVCLSKTLERVRLEEKNYSGIERYKHVTWVKKAGNDVSQLYEKNVTYDNIKMSYGIVAPVGDSYKEMWTVVKENGEQKVSDIRRV